MGETRTLLGAFEIKAGFVAQKLSVSLSKEAGGGVCRKVDFGNCYAGGIPRVQTVEVSNDGPRHVSFRVACGSDPKAEAKSGVFEARAGPVMFLHP